MEIEYLLFLDNLRNSAGHFFNSAIGFLPGIGTERYCILITAFIYWCLNKKYGILTLLTFGVTGFFNSLLKLTFCVYRPYLIDERLSHLPKSTGYSFPSGHASNAAGYLIPIGKCYYKTKIIPILSAIGIITVCFSRNYLGVHTLRDVVAGVGLGGLCFIVTNAILKWSEKGSNRDLIVIALKVLLSICAVIFINYKSYPVDCDETGKLLVDPYKSFGGIYNSIGLILGVIIGSAIEKRFIKFDVPNKITCKIIYYIIGMLSLKGIEHILKNYIDLHEIVDYFMLMIFITVLFPIFIKFFAKIIKPIIKNLKKPVYRYTDQKENIT